ncbi:High affinity nitrate transporter 2.5 [Durusdinium trenchii]|uniref:High affinity nitrate transporter 2.5 n=1 Tax=Durusdinium trenchii TaxID=1381693 RepID=A0ABP0M1P7_9DINO
MDLGGHDLMLDALCRHLGHQSEEKLVALQEPVKRMAAEEGLRGALPRPHQGAASRPSSRRLRNVVEMLRRHSYEVCYLRAALQQALSQSPEVFPPTEALAERQQRLDDFFSSWRESPRKSQGSEKLWPMESTTVGSSWKARGSRSRCTATVTSNWEWSQHLPSTLEEEFTRRRSSGLLLPPLQRETLTLTQADTVDSAAATVATDRFNYVALFPGLAKRKPMPTRRLFLTEDVSSPKGAWKVQELLVERQHPEVESVVAPSELSEAQRLLEGTPKRRTSVTVRPMLTSQSQPLLLEAQRFAPSKPSPKAANLGGLARQLVSMNYEDFQERVFQDRAPDAGDPAPQRLFDRRFRRDMALPVTSSRFARTQGAALSASGDAHHGLPALVQKGSSWEPEREHPVHSPKSAAYFRTCLSQFVLPELLPFFTGHSQKLEAENRQLTDRDVLAMGGLQSPPSAIHFGNNVLLTDKSMVPFLASVLKQPAGSLLSLRLHYCRLGYDSCVKLASLLDSQVAKNLRALNLSGIPFGMAVQVHLASSIREHDKLRDLRLADTQLSADCMELIAENHQLELLDLGWNSMDAQCLAAIGLSLSRNVSLHTLSLPRCSSAGSSIAILLEFLGGDMAEWAVISWGY